MLVADRPSMMRLVGPNRVSGWSVAVVFVLLGAFWRFKVGTDVSAAIFYAAGFTAVMALMASWGLGRCRFGESLPAELRAAAHARPRGTRP